MRGRPPGALVLAVALAACVSVAAARAQADPQLSVTVDRPYISTNLGGKFSFRSTVENTGPQAAENVIAHLNVLSLREGTYVDPEDWSSDRTRYLDPIPAGGSLTVEWQMQAVNDGAFAVYVTALPDTGVEATPAVSPAIRLDVTARRTLNPEGMVPIALGVPLLLGFLALGVRLRRRR